MRGQTFRAAAELMKCTSNRLTPYDIVGNKYFALRQNREDMKWVDLLVYLSPEETGGSMEFALRDYAFVPAVEAIVVNETLLVCHLIV
uniref:DNA_pol3_finger domain-containing protein n=1 Tax=Ascaris lumbricoides TaxID=6252 RepID=A0A0M3HSG1_ASCLU